MVGTKAPCLIWICHSSRHSSPQVPDPQRSRPCPSPRFFLVEPNLRLCDDVLVEPRRPTYALLMVAMDESYQTQIWRGASAAAKLLGIRLMTFVGSSIDHKHKLPHRHDWEGGGSLINKLANSPEIDGYLPLVGCLGNYEGMHLVEEFLDWLPPKPLVCVGVPLPNRFTVAPGGGGIDEIVHHLVQTHQTQDFVYLSGPLTNPDAMRRLSDFRRALQEVDLENNPENEIFGDFTTDKGQALVQELLATGRRPQAIVCANDAMAIGAHKAILAFDLNVPEDLILTGFDDTEEARSMKPPLTTVAASVFQIAYRSVELVHEQFLGGVAHNETIPTEVVTRRSCGCLGAASTQRLPSLFEPNSDIPDLSRLLTIFTDEEASATFQKRLGKIFDHSSRAELDIWEERIVLASRQTQSACVARNLLDAHSALNSTRQGLESTQRLELQHQIRGQFRAIRDVLADLSQEGFAERLMTGLSQHMGFPLRMFLFHEDFRPEDNPAYEGDSFRFEMDVESQYIGPPRQTGIIPPGNDPGIWCFMPLRLGTEHFGIVQVRDWTSNEVLLEGLRQTLTMIFSAAHKSWEETSLRAKFEQLAVRDQMTGLFNRRGLLEQGTLLANLAQREHQYLGVAMFDLDGLKEINDRFGHKDGDLAIQLLGQSLVEGFRQVDVIARLGGDEFAVVAKMNPDGSLDGAVERVRHSLTRLSEELGRPWQARTSGGWIVWDPSEGTGLESVLSRADQNLYNDKKHRKKHQKT